MNKEYERNNMLEKLGFSQFNSKKDTTKYSFDDVTDPMVKKELLLIQQAKLYNDFFAEEQLIASYRGQIANIVNSSRAKQLLGYDLAYQHAVGALKACIRNYTLSSYKNNKPITYFTTNVKMELDKLYKSETSQNTVAMSVDLNQNKNTMANAESILIPKLGRKPTSEELLNFIKNDMGYGKNLDVKKIERIKHYETKELSGSSIIGQENADGAESLTFEDVSNGGKDIGEIINGDIKSQQIIKTIQEFTQSKNERRFLMAYLGIGEFKNGAMKGSQSQATGNNGLSYYSGKKILDKFRDFCVSKGVM